MDSEAFESTFAGILDLNGQDGPHSNILEPKFKAREQALTLEKTLKNCINDSANDGELRNRAQDQMARVLTFIGNNMAECEEEKDALKSLLRAYTCIVCTINGETYAGEKAEDKGSIKLEDVLSVEKPLINASSSSSGSSGSGSSTPEQQLALVETYGDVLNSLGVFLSNRDMVKERVGDALRVLHVVEDLYATWNKACPSPAFKEVPLDEDGNVDASKLPADSAEKLALRRRHRMDGINTNNLYYLAQAYQAKKEIKKASKYVHLTLANQLLCQKEFSKKSWAQHVLSLSAFYTSTDDHAAAKYCLDVGRHVMPKENADEETLGFLEWTFGKFYRNRVKDFGELRKTGASPEQIKQAVARVDYHAIRPSWWVDFAVPVKSPGLGMPPIATFDEAREEFRRANHHFQEALKWYPFDGCCTDHIAIWQDVSDLYLSLMPFEEDLLRQISMQMRRVAVLKEFPGQLNLNAYATLIRQLYFDLGDAATELLDLRMKQREKRTGKPLNDRQMNKLQEEAIGYFVSFVETFRDATQGNEIPKKMEEELKAPFFRALMRIARLESRKFQKTAQDEYDMIARTIERYKECLKFADNNKLRNHEELGPEVKMAQEMHDLLPTKQKEIYRTFQHEQRSK